MSTRGVEATAAAVVLASGSGSRFGTERNKAYLLLAGRPVVSWSLDILGSLAGVGTLVLVAREQDAEHVAEARAAPASGPSVEVVTGGRDRQESELLALRHLAVRIGSGAVDTVLLHDAARPLVGAGLAAEVLRLAREHGGAVPGVECTDLVVTTEDGTGLAEPLAGRAVRAQTPQGFRAQPLLSAYEAAAREGFTGTDTASCVQHFAGLSVCWARGDERNMKITYPSDVAIAERVLAGGAREFRGSTAKRSPRA